MGSKIRQKVNANRRAKPTKHFVIKVDTTEEDLIREKKSQQPDDEQKEGPNRVLK